MEAIRSYAVEVVQALCNAAVHHPAVCQFVAFRVSGLVFKPYMRAHSHFCILYFNKQGLKKIKIGNFGYGLR